MVAHLSNKHKALIQTPLWEKKNYTEAKTEQNANINPITYVTT
jgi:hypothetical protein